MSSFLSESIEIDNIDSSKFESEHAIKNICILDSYKKSIIFERVYKWTKSSQFSNLSKLILSFYQLAEQIDDGGKLKIFI